MSSFVPARLRVTLCVCACGLLLAGCNIRSAAPHQHDHDHGAAGFTDYTGSQDGIWPPQPTGISGVRPIESGELSTALSPELEAAIVASITQNAGVQAELGADYSHIQTEQLIQKGEAPRTISVFFSYSNNQTVEVTKNQTLLATRTFAADAYQPPEGEQEVARAVQLATDKLLAAGYSAVASLDGGALLAFSGGATGEGGFLTSRILYVTFAPGPDTLPEYFAYVDLTARNVLEHGPVN